MRDHAPIILFLFALLVVPFLALLAWGSRAISIAQVLVILAACLWLIAQEVRK